VIIHTHKDLKLIMNPNEFLKNEKQTMLILPSITKIQNLNRRMELLIKFEKELKTMKVYRQMS